MTAIDRWAEWRKLGWPFLNVDNDLITGAAEVGRDLFLHGSFGGFGGWLGDVYPDREWAIEAAREWNAIEPNRTFRSVFRLTLSLEVEIP